MMVDANQVASLTVLKANLARIITQKFGTGELFDVDEIMDRMLIYYDFHQLLQKPGIRLVLNNIIALDTNSDEVAENLSALNTQVESMRCIHLIATDESPKETFTALIDIAFLSEAEKLQIVELVHLYIKVLERVDDLDDINFVARDASTTLHCFTDDVIATYLQKIEVSKQLLQPIKILFAFDQFESKDFDISVDMLQTMLRGGFLRSVEEYQLLIERFKETEQAFLVDTARLLLYFASLFQLLMQHPAILYEYFETEKDNIQYLLNHVSGYDPEDWEIFKEMQEFFKVIIGFLHMMLGMLYVLPVEERIKHLEQAEQEYLNSDIVMMYIRAPSLCWMRAQLLTDKDERKKLEVRSFNLVNELLSRCALEEEPLNRMISMTSLMLLPARWKVERGDFEGALEHIGMAKSLANSLVKVTQDKIGEMIDEFEKELSDPDISEEKKTQIHALRDFFMRIMQMADFWIFACNLLTHISNAKLAESNGNFREARKLYNDAAALEEEMRKAILGWIAIFPLNIASAADGGFAVSQHAIRATYFQGMASLNHGDSELMKGEYDEARKNYNEAYIAFDRVTRSWSDQMERLMAPSQVEARAAVDKERILCLDRMDYCKAKDEMTQAQRYSADSEYIEASDHFDTAATKFNALWRGSIDRETPRNRTILKASERFCKGCALLEQARGDSQESNMRKAKEPIDDAISFFEEANELIWAKYINALRFAYEADIYKKLAYARDSQNDQPRAVAYAQLAQSKAGEAASFFKQIGMEKRGFDMDRLARIMTTTMVDFRVISASALPRPTDAFILIDSNNPVQSMKNQLRFSGVQHNQIISEDKLDRLHSEASALNDNLADLKQQLVDGDIPEERYLLMKAKRERLLQEILLKVRKELGDSDNNLDDIMQNAVTGGQDEHTLMDRLAEVAQQYKMSSALIESLVRHKGPFLLWLIEVGKQLNKLVQ